MDFTKSKIENCIFEECELTDCVFIREQIKQCNPDITKWRLHTEAEKIIIDMFPETIQNIEGWLEDSAEEMASYDYTEETKFFSEYGQGYAGKGGNFSFGKLLGSVMKGGVKLCGGILSAPVTAISHPIQTFENVPQIFTAMKESVKKFREGNWTQKVEIATEMTGSALMIGESAVKVYKNFKANRAANAAMAETEAQVASETESVLAKSAKELSKTETETMGDMMDVLDEFNRLDRNEQLRILRNAECFTAHTKVSTPDGMRNIEELQPGDYVYAEDIHTNVSEIRKVQAVFRRKKDIFVYLQMNKEEICCTPEHPFWEVEKGWIEAKDLLPGDTLKQRDGQKVKISHIRHEKLSTEENVYNMEIEGVHNYYVSNGEILVHNADGYGKVKIESGRKSDILEKNRKQGRLFEQQEFAKFSSENSNAVEQITIKVESGVRTRVDAIGNDLEGNIIIREYKSSSTAPLTNNQKIAFPEIQESGGVVVGKGKGIFKGGKSIPAGTQIKIIRPE